MSGLCNGINKNGKKMQNGGPDIGHNGLNYCKKHLDQGDEPLPPPPPKPPPKKIKATVKKKVVTVPKPVTPKPVTVPKIVTPKPVPPKIVTPKPATLAIDY